MGTPRPGRSRHSTSYSGAPAASDPPSLLKARVVPGAHRGRGLGFPTANLQLESSRLPASGIYAVWVRIEGEKLWRAGAASVGRNPTFAVRRRQMEVHILDYSGGALYGRLLEVAPVAYLREEKRFDSAEELSRQMEQDCTQARIILEATPAPETSR